MESTVLGLVPASLPHTLGYACTFYAPTSPPTRLSVKEDGKGGTAEIRGTKPLKALRGYYLWPLIEALKISNRGSGP